MNTKPTTIDSTPFASSLRQPAVSSSRQSPRSLEGDNTFESCDASVSSSAHDNGAKSASTRANSDSTNSSNITIHKMMCLKAVPSISRWRTQLNQKHISMDEIIKRILGEPDKNAQRNYLTQTDRNGWNIFHYIAKYGVNIKSTATLNLNNINATDANGVTPLRLAIKEGNTEIAKLLIEKGADLNTTTEGGDTSLHFAIEQGKTEIAKLLIEKGADINATAEDGYTPLHLAIEEKKTEVAKLLIEKGADLNAVVRYERTPLHLAVCLGNTELVKLLIEKGADLNATAEDGDTPLHFAIEGGNTELVKLLIEEGADLNATKRRGETPLLWAFINGKTKITKLLIEKDVDINAIDLLGRTPLHWALISGRTKITKLLIENGVDLNVADRDGRTPLDIAKEYKHSSAIRLLEKAIRKGSTEKLKDYLGDSDFQKLEGILSKDPELSDEFKCPIHTTFMYDPVLLADGHVYEKGALKKWLNRSQTSPLTRSPVKQDDLVDSTATFEKIKHAIHQYEEGREFGLSFDKLDPENQQRIKEKEAEDKERLTLKLGRKDSEPSVFLTEGS